MRRHALLLAFGSGRSVACLVGVCDANDLSAGEHNPKHHAKLAKFAPP